MTILDFIRMTRANWKLLILAVAIGLAVMALYTRTQPRIFASDASAYVSAGNSSTVGDSFTGLTLAGKKAPIYATFLGNRATQARVVKELNLPPGSGLPGSVSAFGSEGGVLVQVTARASTPEAARDLADAGVRALITEVKTVESGGPLGGDPVPGVEPTVRLVQVETAYLPGAPFTPNLRMNLLMGLVGGLGLGYLLALVKRQIDRRIRHVEDVETLLGASVLGVIPRTDELSKSVAPGPHGLGNAAEAIRQLRTNLRFVHVDNPPRAIVMTSATPGEGKSTLALSLAQVLAAAGQDTILIDADLRRPRVAERLELDGTIGLTQVLAGDVSIHDALQGTAEPRLSILPAGRVPPNPSELLGSRRMRALIDDLSRDHVVILDAPPLLPVTDAGLLAAMCDGAILVLATARTRKEELEMCGKILSQVGGRLLGVVMNLAPKRGVSNVYYGYGYGYGTGYANYERAYRAYSSGNRRNSRRRWWEPKGKKSSGRSSGRSGSSGSSGSGGRRSRSGGSGRSGSSGSSGAGGSGADGRILSADSPRTAPETVSMPQLGARSTRPSDGS